MSNPYRGLPSVDALLRHEAVAALRRRIAAARLTEHARDVLAEARAAIGANGEGSAQGAEVDADALAAAVVARVEAAARPSLQGAINATGVIIHTNLGRAPLSAAARAAMEAATRSYSNLEFDLESGARGSRQDHVNALIARVVGAEAGLAVNNNASAVLLALSALATGREVIVSRGQAVEIGGGFRIPEVLAQSGARLVEVGTTNRTRAGDYAAAVSDATAAILRVHTSNFRVVGFTAEASLGELRAVADGHHVLLLDDVGSGCLLDTTRFGLAAEPTPAASLAAGADLVMFSGDKLLGGPQAGIVAGRRALVERLARHPLARAMRADKATLAALIATLQHYDAGEAEAQVPVWRMIGLAAEAVRARAESWREAVGRGRVEAGESMVGGGSLPGESLASFVLALGAGDLPAGVTVAGLARRLRLGEPPVVARVESESVRLDPRTVLPEEDGALVAALTAALVS